jgi:hypothetical protein
MINLIIKRPGKIGRGKMISVVTGFAAAIYILLFKKGFQINYSLFEVIFLMILFILSIYFSFVSTVKSKE